MKKYLMAFLAIGISSTIPFAISEIVCKAYGYATPNIAMCFGIVWIASAVGALIVTLMTTLRKKRF